jgi:glucose uptake protein GlcU
MSLGDLKVVSLADWKVVIEMIIGIIAIVLICIILIWGWFDKLYDNKQNKTNRRSVMDNNKIVKKK